VFSGCTCLRMPFPLIHCHLSMLWILLHSSFKQQNSIRNVAFLQSFQAFHEWIRMIPQGIVFFELVLLCNNCTCRCNTDDMNITSAINSTRRYYLGVLWIVTMVWYGMVNVNLYSAIDTRSLMR